MIAFSNQNTSAALTTFFFFFIFSKVALAHSVGVARALKRNVHRRHVAYMYIVHVCISVCLCCSCSLYISMYIYIVYVRKQRQQSERKCETARHDQIVNVFVFIRTHNYMHAIAVYLYLDGAVHKIVAAILLVEFHTHTCNATNRCHRSIDL